MWCPRACAGGVQPRRIAIAGIATIGFVSASVAPAQSRPGSLDAITVSASRPEATGPSLPLALDTIDSEAIERQGIGAGLPDLLGRVPGIVVRDRYNEAQDLQVSSRGFGARASFGVRGVRLVQDGIPLTMPDGQGQTGPFELDSAAHVDALRGPFAALFGNSSGGVVTLYTRDPPRAPTLRLSGGAGSFGTRQWGVGVGTTVGDVGLSLRRSVRSSDGWREHSASRREQWGAKLVREDADGSRLAFVVATLDQPEAQDPLGLTRAQLEENPRQAGTGAIAFDTRKSVEHRQAGLEWRRRLGGGDELKLRAWGGERRMRQYLAFAGDGATSSGGVVDLDRGFGGIGAQWTRASELAGAPVAYTVGVELDRMSERRRGFVNDSGVAGALRRDERDTVDGFGAYAIARWDITERWQLAGGLRHSRVRFRIEDDFITATNPDDSGSRSDSATRAVAGMQYRVGPATRLHAAIGGGFETPTFSELAYRADGQPGPNLSLDAATSTHVEVGLDTRLGRASLLRLSLFRIDTRGDLVADRNIAGRTTYRNADRTRRQGLELGLDSRFGPFEALLAWTWLDARFHRDTSLAGASLAGHRLPGVPRYTVDGEFGWRHQASGFATALTARWNGRVPVDDANSGSADSFMVLGWRMGIDRELGPWRLGARLRIENLLDETHVGSVIVNASNDRFYESAPGRHWYAGVEAALAF